MALSPSKVFILYTAVCMISFSPDSITLEFALRSEKEDLTSWASTLFAGFGQEAKQQNGDHLRKRHNLKSASSKYTEMQNRRVESLKWPIYSMGSPQWNQIFQLKNLR